jgi:hypothetical protein
VRPERSRPRRHPVAGRGQFEQPWQRPVGLSAYLDAIVQQRPVGLSAYLDAIVQLAEPHGIRFAAGFPAGIGEDVVAPGNGVPVPARRIGDKLANAFESAIGVSADAFIEAAEAGTIRKSTLTFYYLADEMRLTRQEFHRIVAHSSTS